MGNTFITLTNLRIPPNAHSIMLVEQQMVWRLRFIPRWFSHRTCQLNNVWSNSACLRLYWLVNLL